MGESHQSSSAVPRLPSFTMLRVCLRVRVLIIRRALVLVFCPDQLLSSERI